MCSLIYRKSSYCRIAHINYSHLWDEEKEQKNTKKKLKILYIQPCCGHTKSSLQYLLNSSWDLEGGILHPEQLSVQLGHLRVIKFSAPLEGRLYEPKDPFYAAFGPLYSGRWQSRKIEFQVQGLQSIQNQQPEIRSLRRTDMLLEFRSQNLGSS